MPNRVYLDDFLESEDVIIRFTQEEIEALFILMGKIPHSRKIEMGLTPEQAKIISSIYMLLR